MTLFEKRNVDDTMGSPIGGEQSERQEKPDMVDMESNQKAVHEVSTERAQPPTVFRNLAQVHASLDDALEKVQKLKTELF